MNQEFEQWVALAMAKVVKKELNIQENDVLLMIPSSGLWLDAEFKKQFPDNIFPELKKQEDLIDDEKTFTSCSVLRTDLCINGPNIHQEYTTS